MRYAQRGCSLGRKGITVNLSQLYYFRKLSELQHYTKAAKELYITQLLCLMPYALSRRSSAFRCFSARGAT